MATEKPLGITPLAARPPLLDRVPPVSYVLAGIISVQTGAAVAKQLFPALGPAGTVSRSPRSCCWRCGDHGCAASAAPERSRWSSSAWRWHA